MCHLKKLIALAKEQNKHNIAVINCLQELERDIDEEKRENNKTDTRDNREN